MKTIQISAQHDTLKVSVSGRFDMSLCFDLWHSCRLEDGQFHTYFFDLGGVEDLRDSGLAWLMMFNRHAAKTGARMCVVNCGAKMAERCLAVGLNMDPATPRVTIPAGSLTAVH